MGMIIYIYLFIFNITFVFLLQTKLDIVVDDYLRGVFLNYIQIDSLTETDKGNGGYKGKLDNIEALPGDTLGILINNYETEYGISATVTWGPEEFKTNSFWMWSNNDTRTQTSGFDIKNYTCTYAPAYADKLCKTDDVGGISYLYKFTFPYLSQCTDTPIKTVASDEVLSIDMSTYVKPNLTFTETIRRLGFVLKADPSGNYHGTFKLSSNSSVIERDTPYLLETITYTPIDYGKLDTVIFYGNSNTNKSSNECTMKIFTLPITV